MYKDMSLTATQKYNHSSYSIASGIVAKEFADICKGYLLLFAKGQLLELKRTFFEWIGEPQYTDIHFQPDDHFLIENLKSQTTPQIHAITFFKWNTPWPWSSGEARRQAIVMILNGTIEFVNQHVRVCAWASGLEISGNHIYLRLHVTFASGDTRTYTILNSLETRVGSAQTKIDSVKSR